MSTTEHLRAGEERLDFHLSPNQAFRYAGHQVVSSEMDYDDLPVFGSVTPHIGDILNERHTDKYEALGVPEVLQDVIDEANARTRTHIIS